MKLSYPVSFIKISIIILHNVRVKCAYKLWDIKNHLKKRNTIITSSVTLPGYTEKYLLVQFCWTDCRRIYYTSDQKCWCTFTSFRQVNRSWPIFLKCSQAFYWVVFIKLVFTLSQLQYRGAELLTLFSTSSILDLMLRCQGCFFKLYCVVKWHRQTHRYIRKTANLKRSHVVYIKCNVLCLSQTICNVVQLRFYWFS